MSKKTRVFIVDDSALIRKLLVEIISSARDFEVVGTASNPYDARPKIKDSSPDVITLDVEMPKMDGLTFLKNIMRLRPTPVVMISSLTEKGADVTLEALELGAIDYVSKPKVDVSDGMRAYSEEILSKLRVAAKAKVSARSAPPAAALEVAPKLSADAVLGQGKRKHFKTTDKILAIGASTGGTEAIKEVVRVLPPDFPGIVIAQHIPEAFSAQFAKRLNAVSAVTVFEAKDNMEILPGHCYVAPGSHHLLVERCGARYTCRLSDGPPVNRHRPAVDVLFRSVAQNVGPNAIGVVLTGMGDDGAAGLKEMLDAGASTIAQDEKSSVVWGMPGEAVKRGAAEKVLPLNKISGALMTLLRSSSKVAEHS